MVVLVLIVSENVCWNPLIRTWSECLRGMHYELTPRGACRGRLERKEGKKIKRRMKRKMRER